MMSEKINQTFFLKIFLILFIACSVKIVFATEYYVDNLLGNDKNTGDPKKPFKSISTALNKVGPGDAVIIIANGPNYPYKEPIIIKNSGTNDSYITIRGQASNLKPIIKGDGTGSILRCYGKHHIVIKDIIFTDSNNQALEFLKSTNVTLDNLEIYNIARNGILVTGGGHDFIVSHCTIHNIGNSGIAMMGSKSDKLSHTIIQDCIISDISSDGITLHRDNKDNNLGKDHKIINNDIRNCGEQGIDVTGGTAITVLNNLTNGNHDSGILIDHGAKDVVVKHHQSINEILYGIIVGHSEGVTIEDSIFKGAWQKTGIYITGSKNLLIENNVFLSMPDRKTRQIVDLELRGKYPTQTITFRKNTFQAMDSNKSTGMMLRILGGGPKDVNIVWQNNIWYNEQKDKKVFYDETNGIYSFNLFKNKYGHYDSFVKPEIHLSPPTALKILYIGE